MHWRKPPKETEKTIRDANRYMTETGGLTGSILDPEFLHMLLSIVKLPFRLALLLFRLLKKAWQRLTRSCG